MLLLLSVSFWLPLALFLPQLSSPTKVQHKFALKSHHIPLNNLPEKAKSSLSAQSNFVPAKFYGAHLLIGNISVGTPGQLFQVAFQLDAASSYLISPEASLDKRNKYKKKIFQSKNSSTFKAQWAHFISDDGDVWGDLGEDVAKLGQLSAFFSFGLAHYVSYYVQKMPIDGEIGLAARYDVKNEVKSMLMELGDQLDEDSQLLSVRINPHEDEDDIDRIPYDSFLTIGAEDREHCQPKWHYVDQIYSESCWKVQLSYFSVGGQKTELEESRGQSVVELNRHLTKCYGPTKWVQQIGQLLSGRLDPAISLYQIDCKTKETLQFGLGERRGSEWKWTVRPEEYMLRQNGKCYLNFYGIDVGGWGFGPVFYRGNCVTLDFGRQWIGFALPLQ